MIYDDDYYYYYYQLLARSTQLMIKPGDTDLTPYTRLLAGAMAGKSLHRSRYFSLSSPIQSNSFFQVP